MLRQCPTCRRFVQAGEYVRHRAACRWRANPRSPHTSGRGWRRLSEEIRKRDGNQCTMTVDGVRCPETDGLQVAHLDRNWMNDDPSNLATLCVAHHRAYDSAA
jgi:hypothetical protein